MADTGWVSAGTGANDTAVGTIAWANTSNITVDDSSYATASADYHEGYRESEIKIIKADGTIGTTNKSTAAFIPFSESYTTYGSNTELWGLTWTKADIEDVDFGIALAYLDNWTFAITNYLKATNFGFSIPTGATITGIEVGVKGMNFSDGPLGAADEARINHVRIKVYYNEPAITPTLAWLRA